MQDKNKETALKTAISQLEKKYGMGTLMRLGDKPQQTVEVIPTGAFNLDIALGIGGIPRGRITEIYGTEASGKTTLALHIAAEAQKLDGVVAFIDAEHALDTAYAKNLGVQTEELLLSQPDGGTGSGNLRDLGAQFRCGPGDRGQRGGLGSKTGNRRRHG